MAQRARTDVTPRGARLPLSHFLKERTKTSWRKERKTRNVFRLRGILRFVVFGAPRILEFFHDLRTLLIFCLTC